MDYQENDYKILRLSLRKCSDSTAFLDVAIRGKLHLDKSSTHYYNRHTGSSLEASPDNTQQPGLNKSPSTYSQLSMGMLSNFGPMSTSASTENLDEIKSELSRLTGVLMQKDSHYQKLIQDMISMNRSQSETSKDKDMQVLDLMKEIHEKNQIIRGLETTLGDKEGECQ